MTCLSQIIKWFFIKIAEPNKIVPMVESVNQSSSHLYKNIDTASDLHLSADLVKRKILLLLHLRRTKLLFSNVQTRNATTVHMNMLLTFRIYWLWLFVSVLVDSTRTGWFATNRHVTATPGLIPMYELFKCLIKTISNAIILLGNF